MTETVTADRPLVAKNLTYSRTIFDASQIKAFPVVSIDKVVLTTAGSFAGNLRGGRVQDQQFTLDGAVTTGSVGNSGQAFVVNPYMIQELKVKTGTYNVEYANALSGVIESVTSNADLLSDTPPKPSTYLRQNTVFDRRHRLVTNLLVDLPMDFSASFLTKAQSGNEFRTKNESTVDPLQLLQTSRRAPWTMTTDMYAQKVFNLGGMRPGVFSHINNIFNRTNINTIGNSPSSDRWVRRGDPVGFIGGLIGGIGTHGNTPRNIWVGLNVAW